jgi:hypothetical protein
MSNKFIKVFDHRVHIGNVLIPHIEQVYLPVQHKTVIGDEVYEFFFKIRMSSGIEYVYHLKDENEVQSNYNGMINALEEYWNDEEDAEEDPVTENPPEDPPQEEPQVEPEG